MSLTGKNVLLRKWRTADQTYLVRYANNRAVWRNLKNSFPHPYAPEDARAWIEGTRADTTSSCHRAIEYCGEAIGSIGLDRLSGLKQRTAAIGYWIGEPFWGRGLCTEALKLMTAFAFDTYDFARIEAGVMEWNPSSGRVLEKAGYLHEGTQRCAIFKDGQLCDLLLYVRLRASS